MEGAAPSAPHTVARMNTQDTTARVPPPGTRMEGAAPSAPHTVARTHATIASITLSRASAADRSLARGTANE